MLFGGVGELLKATLQDLGWVFDLRFGGLMLHYAWLTACSSCRNVKILIQRRATVESGRTAFVAVVEATDLGYRDDFALVRRLNRASDRTVHLKR